MRASLSQNRATHYRVENNASLTIDSIYCVFNGIAIGYDPSFTTVTKGAILNDLILNAENDEMSRYKISSQVYTIKDMKEIFNALMYYIAEFNNANDQKYLVKLIHDTITNISTISYQSFKHYVMTKTLADELDAIPKMYNNVRQSIVIDKSNKFMKDKKTKSDFIYEFMASAIYKCMINNISRTFIYNQNNIKDNDENIKDYIYNEQIKKYKNIILNEYNTSIEYNTTTLQQIITIIIKDQLSDYYANWYTAIDQLLNVFIQFSILELSHEKNK